MMQVTTLQEIQLLIQEPSIVSMSETMYFLEISLVGTIHMITIILTITATDL